MVDPGTPWLTLHPSVHAGGPPTATMQLAVAGGTVTLRVPSAGIRHALATLAGPGAPDDALSDAVLREDGADRLPLWYAIVRTLHGVGALRYSVMHGGDVSASIVPMSPYAREPAPGVRDGTPVALSRFAHLRRVDRTFVLESPLALARIELHDARWLGLVGALRKPQPLEGLVGQVDGIPEPAARTVLGWLQGERMVSAVQTSGRLLEDEDPALADWSFADLLYHVASRAGGHDRPIGRRTDRDGRGEPSPAIPPPVSGAVVSLPAPAGSPGTERDVSLLAAIGRRRSVRCYAARPITVDQLGELLYRAGRVEQRIPAGEGTPPYDTTRRVYPSGGACYPLEMYPVVARCEGLSEGVYHYDPVHHRLETIPHGASAVSDLFDDCRVVDERFAPQVLLVITARFRRVTWAYRSIAYALLLKEVGVLYQNLYLVATAMGLAPCALGVGNAQRFARLLGTQPHEETSVGELLVGSGEPSEVV